MHTSLSTHLIHHLSQLELGVAAGSRENSCSKAVHTTLHCGGSSGQALLSHSAMGMALASR